MALLRKLALIALVFTLFLAAAGTAVAHGHGGRGDSGRNSQPKHGSDLRGAHPSASEHRGRDNKGRPLNGEIMAINGTIWTVDRVGRSGNFRVDVAGARVHWPERPNATVADFRVGDRVNIKVGRDRDDERGRGRAVALSSTSIPQATAVHFVPRRGADRDHDELARFKGTVTAMSSTSLTVNNGDLGPRSFTLNGETKVRFGRFGATIGDIHVGDHVVIITREGDSLALRVSIRNIERFAGTVTAVSATSLTVMNTDLGSRTFTLTAGTRVLVGPVAGVLTDIHVGDQVRVLTRSGDAVAVIAVIRHL